MRVLAYLAKARFPCYCLTLTLLHSWTQKHGKSKKQFLGMRDFSKNRFLKTPIITTQEASRCLPLHRHRSNLGRAHPEETDPCGAQPIYPVGVCREVLSYGWGPFWPGFCFCIGLSLLRKGRQSPGMGDSGSCVLRPASRPAPTYPTSP